MVDQYQHPDFVLTVIPVALFSAYSVGQVVDARFTSIAIAIGLCYLVLIDGLLWHAPTE